MTPQDKLRMWKWVGWMVIGFVCMGMAFVIWASARIDKHVVTPIYGKGESASKRAILRGRDTIIYTAKRKQPSNWLKEVYKFRKHHGKTVSVREKKWLYAVMYCESGGNRLAKNSSGASGLYQIIPKWHPYMRNKLWDGKAQIKYALTKYRSGGKSLWNASKHCWQPILVKWK